MQEERMPLEQSNSAANSDWTEVYFPQSVITTLSRGWKTRADKAASRMRYWHKKPQAEIN
jgi:hypothetical protein